MRASPRLLFACGAPVRDVEPWGKAFSYSVSAHSALFLLLLLMTFNRQRMMPVVLTEVKFIEKTQPVPVAAPPSASEPAIPDIPVRKTTDGTSPRSQSLKADINLNTSGNERLMTGTKDLPPSGKRGEGAWGTAKPLSGPIVTNETMGWVGRKTGALIELSHRSGGLVGKGVPMSKENSGSLREPIALGKMGVEEIRRKESSIGTPLVSQQVVAQSLPGAAKHLAGQQLGERRKSSVESLKANPLDSEKWGKQKGPFSLEGPLKYRKIIKMDLPPYPRWAEEKGIEASVSIRLWVDPGGKVKDNMYLEKTSGYSELDHLAMEALRKFVFVAIPPNQTQEDEWGVATFRFELKK